MIKVARHLTKIDVGEFPHPVGKKLSGVVSRARAAYARGAIVVRYA